MRAVRLRARRGVSLLEAVAAITIVGMTAVSALSASAAEMRTAERARRAIESEQLATSRLDLMSILYDTDLQSLPDSVAKGTFDKPLDEYSWKATSAPVSEQPGVYDVRVTVTWSTGSYTLKSYLYRRPLSISR